MALKRILHWIGSLGVANAPFGLRERVRASNLKVLTDLGFISIFTLFWFALGAWKIFALSVAVSLSSPAILALNGFGFYKTARMVTVLSFSLLGAICVLFLGPSLDLETFAFAGIVSIFANYAKDELAERNFALIATVVLTAGAYIYARIYGSILELPSHWQVLIEVVVWIASGGILISQVRIFLESAERSQSELREREELFSLVFNQAGTGLNIVSPEGKFLMTNAEMARMVGLTPEDVLKMNVNEFTDPSEVERTVKDMGRLKRREIEIVSKERKYRHKNGHFVTASLQARGLYHPDGSLKYFISSVQDLTETKLAAHKLLQASKMSSLGEMAGSIAHEINTPLAIIQLSAERLEDRQESGNLKPEDVASVVKTIVNTVQRVTKIVKGLKSFARDAGQDPMERASIKTIVDDSITFCSEKFKSHGIDLVTNVPDDLSIDCRQLQISQILLNLINNSVSALQKSPPKNRWVKIDASSFGDLVQIRVIDSGPGIAPEYVDRILEPFFTTKPIGEGTGLGLSISKGIIESHGGRLYLDRTHANTCFVIEMRALASGLAAS